MKKANLILRIVSFPLILFLILIKYNFHAIRNATLFLFYGGEWITYAKEDRQTILDIYHEIKTQRNAKQDGEK